ncbi:MULTISPECIES: DUF1674 domain-containing protein [Sphingomonas]|jgi:hypothetical protein|nr:DUF1674 domain-containing protein [Pseudomonas sp. MPR-R2A6]
MARRPPHVKPPAYLSKNPPLPTAEPKPAPAAGQSAKGDPDGLDPTRYGDWELKGIAIDF